MKIVFALIFCSHTFLLLALEKPLICFSDLVSGPSTGNTDISQVGQKGNGGAIITIWGFRFGEKNNKSSILVGNNPALIYYWGKATSPADLYTRLHMYKIEFQIPSGLPKGGTEIKLINDKGDTSNALPFIVRDGRIYFVMKNGNDITGDGSWSNPWATLDNASYTGALEKMKPGDILYIGDGIKQTTLDGDRACIDLSAPGTLDMPKAIIAYPGAKVVIGDSIIQKSYSLWVSGIGFTSHWVIAKLNLMGQQEACTMYHGFRVVGNKITAPTGDGPTGAVAGLGNRLFLLGNELTNIGFKGTSKLYHPIYIQSTESCNGPRLPLEADREIAWNYLHDNLSFDGINIYRECGSSAYMTNHRIHDNYLLNQTGCGIRIGDYVVGENWIYNNVVIQSGLGPDPPTEQAMHVPVMIHAGWDDTTTLIHFYNNTIYGGGFTGGADWASSMVGFSYNHPFQLDFRNNIIVSTNTGIKYLNDRLESPESGVENNIWFGAGNAPGWDFKPINENPQFTDENNLTLSLSLKSIGIDAGIPVSFDKKLPVPEYDIQGNKRKNIIDIGAYEYTIETVSPVRNTTSTQWKIYPNPSYNKIIITPPVNSNKNILEWYTLNGSLLSKEIKIFVKGQNLINIPSELTGIYILKINGESFKIIKY